MSEMIEETVEGNAPALPNACGVVSDGENLLERAENLRASLSEILRLLPEMRDGEILWTAAYAGKLELQGFLLRGACVAELRRRFSTKLTGGRGKRDEGKVGMQARMTAFADSIGVGLRTLMTDLRIYQVFFENAPDRVSTLAGECCLPREFFVTALAAPQPLTAIEIAIQKKRDSTYTRQQYREEVRALKQPAGKAKAKIKPEDGHWIRVQISPTAYKALKELERGDGKTQSDIVTEALLAFHRKREGSPARRGKASRQRGEKNPAPAAASQMALGYSQES